MYTAQRSMPEVCWDGRGYGELAFRRWHHESQRPHVINIPILLVVSLHSVAVLFALRPDSVLCPLVQTVQTPASGMVISFHAFVTRDEPFLFTISTHCALGFAS